MANPAGRVDRYDVPVATGAASAVIPLDAQRHGREWELTLRVGRRAWTAIGPDLFEALMSLRERLDEDEVRICCNGSRRNAWASGMQRDMGEGRFVYLLDLDDPDVHDQVRTLDPAPCEQVGTVAEQREFHADWLTRRRGRHSG